MAKLYFEIEADYKKVIKLREEIEKLQRTMKTFDVHTSSDKIKELESQIKSLRDEYGSLTDKAAKSAVSIEKAGNSIGKALAALGGVAALKSLGAEIVRVRGEFQEMETAIETLVGKQMSDKLIPQIKELAKVSPLTMTDIVGAEKMMLGFNIEADKTIGFLKALSDVSMGNSQKFNSLTLSFSQMSAAGKLMGQDLNQMINAGFNPLQQISIKTGKSIAVLKDEMSKGAISAEMVQQAFIDATSAGGKFYKMSENASKTINGQLSMMEDAWDAALNEMGQKSESLIMSSIQASTSLIQNYETIGKVLVSLVGTYGVYKAALLANIALEKMQVVQRLASIKGITTMSALTGVLTKKMALLNLVTKANPWVLLATAVTGVVAGMWALHDSTTEAEKAQKRLSDRREKESEALAEHERKIDSLIEKSRDIALSDLQRGESLAELRKEYPRIFEQYDLETIKLADILNLKRQIAEEESRRSTEKQARDFAKLNEQIESLQFKVTRGTATHKDKSDLAALKADRDAILQERSKGISEQFISILDDVDAKELDKYVSTLEKRIKGKGNDGKVKMTLPIDIQGSLSEQAIYEVKDIKNLIDTIKKVKDNRLNSKSSSYKEDYELAKKEWEEAKKALADIEKNKEKFTSEDYETAKTKEEAKREAYKKLGGDIESGRGDSEEEAENARRAGKELLSIRRKNQQEEINLMEEGSEKKIAQIELDYKKEMDAINAQREKWKNAQGGTLTDEQSGALLESEAVAAKSRENAIAELRKENLRTELQSLYDYLKEYGTIQQQKYAIAKAYDMKIAEERDANKKKSLQKEKENAIASADAANLAMGIDWGAAFEGVGNVLKDIAVETLKKVEDYMKTDEFKGLSAENKKTYSDFRAKLREETGEGATSPFNFKQWGVIAQQVKEYQESVKRLKDAQAQHTIAVENLNKAEEELLNATDDVSKEMAKVKVDMAKKQVDITATNQNKAQEESDESKENLTESTNNAAEGLRNFSSTLNEMGSGSLYGFANGVTKLITSLSKGSDGIGKSLGELGGKVGGIVGAILQILDALGDDPKQFIEDLLKRAADAVEGIIRDLPQIIGSVFEGVFDIVGGLFAGIGSWFGLDKMGESDKTLKQDMERLSNTNEALASAIERLTEEMADATIMESVEIYERQKQNLIDSMENTSELMQRSAKAYSDGFLGIGGSKSSNTKVNNAMREESRKILGMDFLEYGAYVVKNGDYLWNKVSEVVGFSVQSASEFFALSSENMAKVAREAPEIYALIKSAADDGHENAAQYMDEYIEYYKQLQELENDYREKLTYTSFDSIRDDFKSLLMDMEADSEDFAKAFENMMKNAILESFILTKYQDRLQQFYENFANAMESGGTVDETEQDALRQQWEDYASQAMAERDALWETMGWDKSTYSQEASSKGFQAMSQDTGEELNGRFTALQATEEEIKNYVSIINITTNDIKNINIGIKDSLSGIQDQIAGSYLELVAINENTGMSAKYLKDIKNDISEVRTKIKSL